MMTTWTKVITVEMERGRQNLESFQGVKKNHLCKIWWDSSILLIIANSLINVNISYLQDLCRDNFVEV